MLDKLKGAFFYTEEEDMPAAKPAPLPPVKGFTRPTGPATPSTVHYGAPAGSDVSIANAGTMKEQILVELEKATTEGAYGKFKKMSSSFKARIPDNAQRVIAVGATLDVSGVKTLDIIGAAQSALGFLDSETNNFETEATSDSQNADAELAKLKANVATAIVEKEAQIKKLQDEIAEAQQEELQFSSETIKAKGAIEVSRAQFKSAMAQVKAEVEQDLKDVQLYLGGA